MKVTSVILALLFSSHAIGAIPSNSTLSFISDSDKTYPYFITPDGANHYLGKDFSIRDLDGFRLHVYDVGKAGNINDRLDVLIDYSTTLLDLSFNSNASNSGQLIVKLIDSKNTATYGNGIASFPSDYSYYYPKKFLKCKTGFECNTLSFNDKRHNNLMSSYVIHRAKKNNRIGPLFVHTGGPEGSQAESLFSMIKYNAFPQEIVDKFDIVAVDDIGFSHSSGGLEFIECSSQVPNVADELEKNFTNSNIDNYSNSYFTKVRNACDSIYQKYSNVAGTLKNVDVWEKLRSQVFPGEQISILGISYGGKPAINYDVKYPANTRAIIFDSVDRMNDNLLIQLLSLSNHIGNRLVTDEGIDIAKLSPYIEQVYSNGRYVDSSGNSLNVKDIMKPTFLYLVLNSAPLKNLSKALDWLATSGDASKFVKFFKDNPNLDTLPTWAYNEHVGKKFASRALTSCTDGSFYSNQDLLKKKNEFISNNPLTGRLMYQQSLQCVDWAHNRNPLTRHSSINSAKKVLVINGLHDRVVAPSIANQYVSFYGTQAKLITTNQRSHSFVFSNKCIKDMAVKYLINPGNINTSGTLQCQ